MRVFYGGAELKLIQTLPGTSRKVVRSADNTQVLYTRWTLDFLALYNPAATVMRPSLVPSLPLSPPIPPNRTVFGAPTGPAFTDTQLRDLERQDRKQLLVFSEDGQLWVQSPLPMPGVAFATLNTSTGAVTVPQPAYAVDATTGPRVQRCDVVEVHGIRSFVMHWTIETDVCEAMAFGSAGAAEVLSHRWESRLDVNQDHLATRIIRGELVFRADEMLRLRNVPDQYRRIFGHPVGKNMARTAINVRERSDNCTIDYEVVDTERHFNLGNDPLFSPTRLEVFLTSGLEKPSTLATAAAAAAGLSGQWAQAGVQYAQTKALAGAARTRAAGAGTFALATATVELAQLVARIAIDSTPKYQYGITVRAWGNREMSRASLHNLCFAVAFGRLGEGGIWRFQNIEITHDMTGKFVEVSLSYAFGLEEAVINVATGQIKGLLRLIPLAGPGVAKQFDDDLAAKGVKGGNPLATMVEPFAGSETLVDETGHVRAGRILASQNNDVPNKPFPHSGGMAGTWLGNLVAQVLYDAGTAYPPAVPAYTELTDVVV